MHDQLKRTRPWLAKHSCRNKMYTWLHACAYVSWISLALSNLHCSLTGFVGLRMNAWSMRVYILENMHACSRLQSRDSSSCSSSSFTVQSFRQSLSLGNMVCWTFPADKLFFIRRHFFSRLCLLRLWGSFGLCCFLTLCLTLCLCLCLCLCCCPLLRGTLSLCMSLCSRLDLVCSICRFFVLLVPILILTLINILLLALPFPRRRLYGFLCQQSVAVRWCKLGLT